MIFILLLHHRGIFHILFHFGTEYYIAKWFIEVLFSQILYQKYILQKNNSKHHRTLLS